MRREPTGAHVEDLLLLELDGALPQEELAGYQEHLASCRRCRRLREQHHAIQRALADPGDDVEAQRRRSLDLIRAGLASPPRRARSATGRLALTLAAVLVLLLAGAITATAVYPAFVRHPVAVTSLAMVGATVELVAETEGPPIVGGGASPVVIVAHLRFAAERSGRLTLMASEGSGPPVTLTDAVLSHATRGSLEARLPSSEQEGGHSYRVWLRFESDALVTESSRATIEVTRSDGHVDVMIVRP